MSQLLVLVRNWPARMDNQRKRLWRWVPNRDVNTLTLGIVGLGEIGLEAARLAKAFGMRVLAMKRNTGALPSGVDAIFPPAALHAMLPQCDAVLISTAYTPQTAGLFDRAALAAMKPGAFLLNVARGGIVDEDALADALKSGHLRGAAFDVFAQEPLPAESPIWDLPNMLVTAHNSVGLVDYGAATFDRFVENFSRFARGEPLFGVVDPIHGY